MVTGTMRLQGCPFFDMSNQNHDSISMICPSCGKNNNCKMDASCWCMSKPQIHAVPKVGVCRCESCLDKENTGYGTQSVLGEE